MRVLMILLLLPVPLLAGISGCDDLAAIPETPQVDFSLEIQPIFDDNCVVCHGGPNPIADMNLELGYEQLVSIPSFQIPGLNRIEPNLPSMSYLFFKINCSNQLSGDRMPRDADPLNVFDQALIRDWINQMIIFSDGFEE
ncbi:hypothetical protein ACFODZ_15890 [Marinicella sediminis]|uniref:Cytochrome C Planctomycete-type domain-containing protein n=1 Tax=Marinicella sediminis TaxID=1792834 RepID=A0ABV7JEV2_9GAMM|nr:hypothetical protein [Marinicella sediminis]